MFRQTLLAMAAMAIIVAGCNSSGISVGPGMTYRSTDEKQDCNAVVKDGKLTWSAKAVNTLQKRGYSIGMICLHTNVNMIVDIKFETSVEANTTLDVGEKDVVIEGMPKDWQVTNKNVCIIPGAGCETPTTHVAGNWPLTPFKATYKATPTKVMVEKELAPLDITIDNLESVTDADCKLVTSTFILNNKSKIEVTCKVLVVTKTNDGRTDSRPFEYSLLPGEKKEVKCILGFSKPFKASDTTVHIDGKEKAVKKVAVKKVAK